GSGYWLSEDPPDLDAHARSAMKRYLALAPNTPAPAAGPAKPPRPAGGRDELVGRWHCKVRGDDAGYVVLCEFHADGTFALAYLEDGDKKPRRAEGTYRLGPDGEFHMRVNENSAVNARLIWVDHDTFSYGGSTWTRYKN